MMPHSAWRGGPGSDEHSFLSVELEAGLIGHSVADAALEGGYRCAWQST
jgi:hypothetical protein